MAEEDDEQQESDFPGALGEPLEGSQQSPSLKTPVLRALYQRFRESGESIVYSNDLIEAIKSRNHQIDLEHAAGKASGKPKKLSTKNPANFLKDVIRTPRGNLWWPKEASDERITARQRYGKQMVFQFADFLEGYDLPFPDRFLPCASTSVLDVQSASIPYLARNLGRSEETWLTQIAVYVRLVEAHMSIFSPLRKRLRDITHLQMGMKTQPEIDATFVMTLKNEVGDGVRNVFVTCEAKQIGERLLEDQIKTQVAKAMEETKSLKDPRIHSVLPLSLQVMEHQGERLIYVVEFQEIERDDYETNWKNLSKPPDDERLYRMELVRQSEALYRPQPAIPGISG